MRALCVFCGSKSGANEGYIALAREVGALIAGHDVAVVYGGGRVGLMGALADAALAVGGRVIGVIPQMLIEREVGHSGLSELHVVRSMAERKELMGSLSDGFLTLPGGTGTMDELFEAWTWTQLGLQRKPSGLLNFQGYYDPLVEFLDRAVSEGFLDAHNRANLWIDHDVARLVARLCAGSPDTL
jgi:uncharacterized protein (TIGR00730 family)